MCPGSPSTQGWCGMPGKARPGVMGGFSHLPFCPASSLGHIGGAPALLLPLHHHPAACCGEVLRGAAATCR